MAVTVPNHTAWTKFKTALGIPKGAVKGVDMGKSLDTYHDGLSGNFLKNAELAKKLADTMAKYLKGFPAAKLGKAEYTKFKSDFTSHYLSQAEAAIEEFKSMGGDKAAFAGRVALLLREAAKLKAGATLEELQNFRSGAVRGMMAAATKVKGYDPAKIVQHWTPVDEVINKLAKDSAQPLLDKVVEAVVRLTNDTKKIVTEDKLAA